MTYHDLVDPLEYDRAILCHPLIDQMKARVAYRLLESLHLETEGKTVLDVGAGTGTLTRFLKGIPGLRLHACDIDPKAETFFRSHPEHSDISFTYLDVLAGGLVGYYEVIVSSGVYHHIPKSLRPSFLREICSHARIVILADEGISEYSSEDERRINCSRWYGYVIEEAKRRGLEALARMEADFLENDLLGRLESSLDYKESPDHFMRDSISVGLTPTFMDRLGPWKEHGGGFFVATYLKR